MTEDQKKVALRLSNRLKKIKSDATANGLTMITTDQEIMILEDGDYEWETFFDSRTGELPPNIATGIILADYNG